MMSSAGIATLHQFIGRLGGQVKKTPIMVKRVMLAVFCSERASPSLSFTWS